MFFLQAALAGGPYYCSQGVLSTALTLCMQEGYLIDVANLNTIAQASSDLGEIDSLSNLNGSRVWLYSGTQDTVVATSVVQATQSFYSTFVNKSAITFVQKTSQHTQLTLSWGNPCTYLGSPYMGACGWSAAQSQLSWLYPDSFTPATPTLTNLVNIDAKGIRSSVDAVAKSTTVPGQSASWRIQAGTLYSFDQTGFVVDGWSASSGLNPTAFAFVPDACNATAAQQRAPLCRLHVSFHGCNQQPSAIGSEFFLFAGYIEQALANNLVLLFPQAAITSSNPEGCFDWWAYTDPNFAIKKGVQNGAFMGMVNAIAAAGGAASR